jgi:hypothetical protein
MNQIDPDRAGKNQSLGMFVQFEADLLAGTKADSPCDVLSFCRTTEYHRTESATATIRRVAYIRCFSAAGSKRPTVLNQ